MSNQTITVSGTQSVDALWVQQGGITLTGGTLDMTGTSGILRDDAGGLVIDSAVTAGDLSILGDVSINHAGNAISGNVAVAGTLSLGASQAFGSLTGAGTVALGSHTLSAGGADDFSFAGTFTGGPGSTLEKTGSGTMSLTSLPNAVETLNLAAGTLALPGGTLNSALAGSGTFHKTGSGNFVLNSTGNTGFTGQVRVSGGIFRVAADSSLGAAPAVLVTDAIVLENGARIQGGSASGGADLTIDANRGITLNNGNSAFHTWTGFTTTVNAPIANGTLDDGNGGIVAANLTKSDGGTLILNGGSTHTGDTRVESGTMIVNSAITSSNKIRLSGVSTLGLGTGAEITTDSLITSDGNGAQSTINHADGTLNITGTNKSVNLGGGTLGSLASWSTSKILTLTGTNGDSSIAPAAGHQISLNNGLTGAAGFSMDGEGTLVLGGASDFAGTAVVGSGTFHLAGSISSELEIASGGTLRTGTPATPGASSVGSLTLGDGSSSVFRVGPGGDLLTISATDGFTVQPGANHTINVIPAGPLAVNDQVALFDYEGTIQGEGFGGLSLGALPNPHYLASLVNDTTNSQVLVRLDSITPVVWTGANSDTWDVETTQNFALKTDSSPSVFYTYDVVEFDDTASQFAVTLAGALTPASVSFDHSSNDYSLSGGAITGLGSLSKAGSGTLTLLNAGTTRAIGGQWATSFFGNGTRSITINDSATLEQTQTHDLGGLGATFYRSNGDRQRGRHLAARGRAILQRR